MAGHSKYCLKIGPGIRCLTGAYVERVDPPNINDCDLWQKLLKAKKSRTIMECSTRNHPDTQRMGLVCYHAYSVVGLAELKNGTRLLKIRNTWGHGEWTGCWCDNDPRWTESIKRQVDHFVDSDDGSFYIDLNDFSHHFNRLYFATFDEDPEEAETFSLTQKGYWIPPFAGGSDVNNPQYFIEFEDETDSKRVTIKLKIPHSQFSMDGGRHQLVILACGVDENTKKRVKHLANIIKQSHEAVARQVELNLHLPAHMKGIIIIPCWDDGTEGNAEQDKGSFKLTVECLSKFGVRILNDKTTRRGSARAIERDLGRASVVPAEWTGGQSTFESLTKTVNEKVRENCLIS